VALPEYALQLKLTLAAANWMQVSALPCFHTFHQGCVEPWLRQQGRASTCPICKTPVFEGRA